MKLAISPLQQKIRVGTHGEDYGSWMSNPVFYFFGGIALVAAVLAALSFTLFHLPVLGILLLVAVAALLALKDSGAVADGGMVSLFFTPAEEYTDMEFRKELIAKGEKGLVRYEFEPDDEMLNEVMVKYPRSVVR